MGIRSSSYKPPEDYEGNNESRRGWVVTKCVVSGLCKCPKCQQKATAKEVIESFTKEVHPNG